MNKPFLKRSNGQSVFLQPFCLVKGSPWLWMHTPGQSVVLDRVVRVFGQFANEKGGLATAPVIYP